MQPSVPVTPVSRLGVRVSLVARSALFPDVIISLACITHTRARTHTHTHTHMRSFLTSAHGVFCFGKALSTSQHDGSSSTGDNEATEKPTLQGDIAGEESGDQIDDG